MLSLAAAFVAALTAAAALAAPVETGTKRAAPGPGAKIGEATYYEPGLGACGKTNSAADMIVAISPSALENKQKCGHRLRAQYNGKTVEVEAVDLCMGCKPFDLDLTPAAFKKLGEMSAGRLTGVTWEWI
ncbi:riboflavine-aldehyde-forming enzyme [Metarhizium album ARSEF 1941]|uniref:Riboflavine-aldehyde-forming enzyme n=1 Tax=Metarhizium album (strain ARSEF 1941) TaxID=1081103 RepID=A0A0B2WEI2_METAS|nr:riboflavine-aldehyde-forming enzyme [Metarhizium album ARSEF 1941]KHN94236.1 riboflavine-aldehyde-forming enzyme [Metarhizium album ARSEF 1941]